MDSTRMAIALFFSLLIAVFLATAIINKTATHKQAPLNNRAPIALNNSNDILPYDARIVILNHKKSLNCCNKPTVFRNARCWDDYVAMVTLCSYNGTIFLNKTMN